MLSGDETDKYAETHNAEYNPDEPNCAKTDTANIPRCSEADLAKKTDPAHYKQQARMKKFEENYNKQHYSLVKLTQAVEFLTKKFAERGRSKNRNSKKRYSRSSASSSAS